MFFKYVQRNASKNRKNNGLFFGSLVIAIVAFYTLLSLGDQDVMLFLKTMESDAVSRLMLMIPVIYIISLFFVFFLVYFAYRYQLDNRKKEFGLYMMMGMKRNKLFAMLMSETLWNSIISVLIGLPIALLLTEGISLATAKVVGLGIIGHRISFSISAVLGTVIGFVIVQLIAMFFLCVEFSRKEPMQLLQMDSADKQVSIPQKTGWLCFVLGLIFLILAYVVGVIMLRGLDLGIVALILVLGGTGTFLFYHGIGVFIGRRIHQKSSSQSGLFTFTGRQIQENVLHQYKALAISSLLLLMALACVSFGIGIASGRGSADVRTTDFSIEGTEQEVSEALNAEANRKLISTYYPMFLSHMDINTHECSMAGLNTALISQPKTELRNNIIENISNRIDYIISATSYNNLLESIGKEPIRLEKNQVALYTSMKDSRDFIDILNGALKSGAYIEIDNQRYELLNDIYYDNVVADRKITLYSALIVSDENYQNWVTDNNEPFCWNLLLSPDLVKKQGLMQSLLLMEKNLAGTGLEYESYIEGVGRNLFYTVAASYLTIYLGILFMIIANTVIGLKYLIQQRTNKHRYLTLLMFGVNKKELCDSARKQIRLYFFLVLGMAVCSSVFAVWSMFTSFMKLPAGVSASGVILLSGIGFILFVVIEFIYITIVEHASKREILELKVTDRR
ncbi:ABC transporter permease [Vallitalea longa]|uniref:ABC transporter permease n=1 Tax=Vallitalea longa TaxID=2936439 RepID=A0A9W5Y9F8_9FIRM|nr:ABC transporter permease [Vallitalea longa]GKX29725.1 ABC transporter permease [Vallitalea longa]